MLSDNVQVQKELTHHLTSIEKEETAFDLPPDTSVIRNLDEMMTVNEDPSFTTWRRFFPIQNQQAYLKDYVKNF